MTFVAICMFRLAPKLMCRCLIIYKYHGHQLTYGLVKLCLYPVNGLQYSVQDKDIALVVSLALHESILRVTQHHTFIKLRIKVLIDKCHPRIGFGITRVAKGVHACP